MKKRNPLAVVLLSIITLGIYDLYWLVKTKKVLNEKTKHHIPSIWILIAPIIIILIGYILIFVAAAEASTSSPATSVNSGYNYSYGYSSPNNTSTISSSSSSSSSSAVIILVAYGVVAIGFLAALIISIIWFYKFSKAINEYTQGKMTTAVAFLILYLIHLIGVALIQDIFNDMENNGQAINNNFAPAMAGAPFAAPVNNSPQQTMPLPQNQSTVPVGTMTAANPVVPQNNTSSLSNGASDDIVVNNNPTEPSQLANQSVPSNETNGESLSRDSGVYSDNAADSVSEPVITNQVPVEPNNEVGSLSQTPPVSSTQAPSLPTEPDNSINPSDETTNNQPN